jgi:hypothetical protein
MDARVEATQEQLPDAGQFGVSTGDGMDAGVEAMQDAIARCAVDKPRSPPANLAGRMPARRGSGVAFSFGYFSLGHAREK